MVLSEYQKKWNRWVNTIRGNPKYEYHKNHDKYLKDEDSSFSEFLRGSVTKVKK